MKIHLAMENPCLLSRRLLMEGDEIVKRAREADLIYSDKIIEDKRDLPPVIGGDLLFSKEVTGALGYKVSPLECHEFSLSLWFSPSEGWLDQAIFTFPLRGLMNYNLSTPLVVGGASRYVDDSPLVELLTESPSLEATLKRMTYNGFVSLLLDFDLLVVGVSLGIPDLGFLQVLEGCRGKISDFLVDPSGNRLHESWTASLLVSRYPYPHKERGERVWLREVCQDFEKHFYFFNIQGTEKSLYTDLTRVGIVTSWATNLGEANRRVLWTSQNLSIPLIQYRTDLSRSTSDKYHRLIDLDVVGRRVSEPT